MYVYIYIYIESIWSTPGAFLLHKIQENAKVFRDIGSGEESLNPEAGGLAEDPWRKIANSI